MLVELWTSLLIIHMMLLLRVVVSKHQVVSVRSKHTGPLVVVAAGALLSSLGRVGVLTRRMGAQTPTILLGLRRSVAAAY